MLALILLGTGKVAVWGDNKHGQLAMNPTTHPQVNSPHVLPEDLFSHQHVTEIHSGWTHMVAVTGRKKTQFQNVL